MEDTFVDAETFVGCKDLTVVDIEECRRAGGGRCARLSKCDGITLDTWSALLAEPVAEAGNLERVLQLAFGQGHLFALFFAVRRDRLWGSLRQRPRSFARGMVYAALQQTAKMHDRDGLNKETDATLAELLNNDNADGCTPRLQALNDALKIDKRVGLNLALQMFNAAGLAFWYRQLCDCILQGDDRGYCPSSNASTADTVATVLGRIVKTAEKRAAEKKVKPPNLIEALHNSLEIMMPMLSNAFIPGFTAAQLRETWKTDVDQDLDLDALAAIKKAGGDAKCGAKDVVPSFRYMNDPTPREDMFCPPGTSRRRYPTAPRGENGSPGPREFGGCCKKSVADWRKVKQRIWDSVMTGKEAKQSMQHVQELCRRRHDALETELGELDKKPAKSLDEKARETQIREELKGIEASYPTDAVIADEAERRDFEMEQMKREWEKEREKERKQMQREMADAVEMANAGAGGAVNATGGLGDAYEAMMKKAYQMALKKVELKLRNLVRYDAGDDDEEEEVGRMRSILRGAKRAVLGTTSFTADLLIRGIAMVLQDPRLLNVVLMTITSYRNQLCQSISIKLGKQRLVNAYSAEGARVATGNVTETFMWGYEMIEAVSGPGMADSMKAGAEMFFEVAEVGSSILPVVGPGATKLAKCAGGYLLTSVHQGVKVYFTNRMYSKGLATAMELFTAPCIQEQKKLCGYGTGTECLVHGAQAR